MTTKKDSLLRIFGNLLLIMCGCAVYSVGLNGIVIPQGFLNGGLVGVSLIVVYLVPGLSLGLMYFLLNIPLLLIGWFSVSRRFIGYTIFGSLWFSLMAEVVKVHPFPVQNPILAAILAGIICGIGGGLILKSQGSAGGMDILSVYLYKKLSLRFGMSALIVNSVVLTFGALVFSLEMALYTLIFVFTVSRITDSVITGFNVRKSVLIVSDKSQDIADLILKKLDRGVTFLDGQGAWTGQRKKVILTVVTMTDLAELKTVIFDLDPHAFVVVNDTLDVIGERHGRLKVY